MRVVRGFRWLLTFMSLIASVQVVSAQGRPSVVWMQGGLATEEGAVLASPNGKLLSVNTGVSIYLYNTTTGLLVQTISPPATYQGIGAIAFSADSSMLAVGMSIPNGSAPTIALVNISTGAVTIIKTGITEGDYIAFSPNGKTLAIGGNNASNNGSIEFWNIATNTLANTLPTKSSRILSVAFSPDGSTFVDGGIGATVNGKLVGNLEMWSVSNLSTPVTLPSGNATVNYVEYSVDGKTLVDTGLVMNGPETVETWSMPSGKLAANLTLSYSGSYLPHFSVDGKTIYLADAWGLYSCPTALNAAPTPLISQSYGTVDFTVLRDGKRIAFPDNVTIPYEACIALFTMSTWQVTMLGTSDLIGTLIGTPDESVAFTSDSKTLYVSGETPGATPLGSAPAGLMAFNAATGAPTVTPHPVNPGNQGGVYAKEMSVSADGKTVAMATAPNIQSAGVTTVWPVGGMTYTLPTSLSTINTIAFAATGSGFVDAGVGGFGGEAEYWSGGFSKAPAILPTEFNVVSGSAISHDGTLLALSYNTGIEVWSLKTLIRLGTVTTTGSVNGMAFSPDDKTLAVAELGGTYGNSYGVIEWFSLSNYARLSMAKPLSNTAYCLTYSNGGSYLFVGTDQSILIYHNSNFGLTTTYNQEVQGGVISITMAPSGAAFAYVRGDGAVVMAQNPNAAQDIQVHLEVIPGSVSGGATATATITLSAPAPTGGMNCTLTSGSKTAAPTTAFVHIPAGESVVHVVVNTTRPAKDEEVVLEASVPANLARAQLKVTR